LGLYCEDYGENRICLNNICICSSNYTEDNTSKKCVSDSDTTTITPFNYSITLISKEKNCSDKSDCGSNQFCVNNMCECRPNYEYSDTHKRCKYKPCSENSDCQSFDTNRICEGGFCNCRSGYVIDPETKFCKNQIEKYCDSIDDCDSNEFCVKNKCECLPNYQIKTQEFIGSICELSHCQHSSDCQDYDSHRVCNKNGVCICVSGYKLDSKTQICNQTNGTYCNTSEDCGNNQYCNDNRCECTEEYYLAHDYESCVECISDSDCNGIDWKICDTNGLCVYKPGYELYTKNNLNKYSDLINILYPQTIKPIIPIPTICREWETGDSCTSDSDCNKCNSGLYACYDNKCESKFDHDLNCKINKSCNDQNKSRLYWLLFGVLPFGLISVACKLCANKKNQSETTNDQSETPNDQYETYINQSYLV
jgi:hypothetical protein